MAAAVGDAAVGDGWSLPPDVRQRIVNKIVESLQRNLPNNGPDGLQHVRRIATGFEERIYTNAQSQTDYLRRISLKMLTLEDRFGAGGAGFWLTSPAGSGAALNQPPYDEY